MKSLLLLAGKLCQPRDLALLTAAVSGTGFYLIIPSTRQMARDTVIHRVRKMHRDFVPAQKSPVCPACGRYMKFARLVEQDREVGLTTFECGHCCVSFTTAAARPEGENVS